MDKALYVAMTGATQTLRAQSVNNHNLANASTVGFRAELAASQAVAVNAAGVLPTRVNAQLSDAGWDASSGALMSTGRELDMALGENKWLAVQASDGSEAYTRAGDLRVDANGQLRNGAGHAVLGDGGPLSAPPHSSISIGSDGTLSIVPLGQSASTQAAIGRLRIVEGRPDQLQRGTDGLMRAKPGATLDTAAGDVLTSGMLESSNVNMAEAMVNMISLARQFELQVKLMKTVEDNATASASLTRLA